VYLEGPAGTIIANVRKRLEHSLARNGNGDIQIASAPKTWCVQRSKN
jgi:hypothetical protein